MGASQDRNNLAYLLIRPPAEVDNWVLPPYWTKKAKLNRDDSHTNLQIAKLTKKPIRKHLFLEVLQLMNDHSHSLSNHGNGNFVRRASDF